jgi:4-alpha-glucanotransferase
LFYTVRENLGRLPVIVENIGVIPEELEQMRTELATRR